MQPKTQQLESIYGSIRKELGNIDWEPEVISRNATECGRMLNDKLMRLSDFLPYKNTSNTSKKNNDGTTKTTIREIKKREN